MDSLKLRFVFNRKKTANKTDKQGALEVYVYDKLTGKKVYISTGIDLLLNQFEQKKGEIGIIKNHPNAVSKNGQAKRIMREIEAFALSDKCQTIEDVKKWNKKEETKTHSVISFIEDELKRRNPSLTVLSQNKSLIKRMIEFGRFKTFKDFTYENVVDFDAYLKSEGMQEPTAYKRHQALHSYIREAINRGYCTYDPYITFRPKKGQSKDPVYLEEDEINILLNCDLKKQVDSDKLEKVRDLFVFQCFTGLAYVDLMAFSKEEITEVDGYKVIRSNRTKTDQGFISVLLPEALAILEKYNYSLPRISNQKYNDYLKLVGLYATEEVIDEITKEKKVKTIRKKLTTHVARHTFGTYLINKGVPLETVARTMGHSNIKMTQHYAKLLGKTVVSDIVNHVIKPTK
ncbi:hypothetical protein E2605_18000 [Dysgonomonas capnocytophagoides]|uniref:Site-specific integrase n=1 Tax=Dysgonomonas capnocytophagoides TaxID=45254 RepID=A0A4Y8KVP6_9BACT|nr:site-specific integrase [Dysgonomonas capnocytophagoides]TFD93007.1 hypothetical protein E2605_18000 [Dysgonomonas capnocytophagoides]